MDCCAYARARNVLRFYFYLVNVKVYLCSRIKVLIFHKCSRFDNAFTYGTVSFMLTSLVRSRFPISQC